MRDAPLMNTETMKVCIYCFLFTTYVTWWHMVGMMSEMANIAVSFQNDIQIDPSFDIAGVASSILATPNISFQRLS
jgi:hypothetical protein